MIRRFLAPLVALPLLFSLGCSGAGDGGGSKDGKSDGSSGKQGEGSPDFEPDAAKPSGATSITADAFKEAQLEGDWTTIDCSEAALREALTEVDSAKLRFDHGGQECIIALTQKLHVQGGAHIVIDGEALVTLDGQESTQILQVDGRWIKDYEDEDGTKLLLRGLRLANGTAENSEDGASGGGAIHAGWYFTRLYLDGCSFENNHSPKLKRDGLSGYGGAIAMGGGRIFMRDSAFSANQADTSGGAIYGVSVNILAEDSRFSDNEAAKSGGAIMTDGAHGTRSTVDDDKVDHLYFKGVSFENNSAGDGQGGAYYCYLYGKDRTTIDGCTFRGNQVGANGDGFGGAISKSRRMLIKDSVFDKNTASLQGGALYSSEEPVIIERSLFTDNEVIIDKEDGTKGGIGGAVTGQIERLVNSTFVGNRAGGFGGALWIQSEYAKVFEAIVNCTFAFNEAEYAGALNVSDAHLVTLTNTILFDNVASNEWNKRHHTNAKFADGGGNIQYPAPEFDDDIATDGVQFVDPQLQDLADNGGPTRTMALGADSPALDAGTDGPQVPSLDQRGQSRDDQPDMGAYELTK